MKWSAMVLAVLLGYSAMTIWVQEPWAWGIFQIGIFALAGWRTLQATGFPRHAALVPLAFSAIWPFFQLALHTTVSRTRTISQGLTWFTFLLVFALSSELLANAVVHRRFLGFVTVFGMVMAFVSTLQKFSSAGRIFWLFPSSYDDYVLGPFVSRNQFAAWVELLLPVAFYLAATRRHWRPLFGCAAVILFSSIVASASRAGFVLGCAEMLVVGAVVWAKWAAPRKALRLALEFLLLAAAGAAIVGWQDLATRWKFGQSEAIRVDAVRASWQMVRDRPWMGSGLGTWSIMYPRYAGLDAGVFVNQAHDDWVQWTAEGGLPFVFCMAVFAALLWKPAIRSIYGVGTVAFLLHAFVDYPMQQRPALAAWFFAVAGAVAAWPGSRTRSL